MVAQMRSRQGPALFEVVTELAQFVGIRWLALVVKQKDDLFRIATRQLADGHANVVQTFLTDRLWRWCSSQPARRGVPVSKPSSVMVCNTSVIGSISVSTTSAGSKTFSAHDLATGWSVRRACWRASTWCKTTIGQLCEPFRRKCVNYSSASGITQPHSPALPVPTALSSLARADQSRTRAARARQRVLAGDDVLVEVPLLRPVAPAMRAVYLQQWQALTPAGDAAASTQAIQRNARLQEPAGITLTTPDLGSARRVAGQMNWSRYTHGLRMARSQQQ